ncbi:MAG TPA: DUF2141 domain-containing protein [Bacteroidales bacterium]|nr:DUF2141 domain-containing protein [Bacteroidales bacterium]
MSKYFFLSLALFLAGLSQAIVSGQSRNVEKTGVNLILGNIRPGKGLIRIGVFTSDTGYPDKPQYSFSVAKDTLQNGMLRLFIPLLKKSAVSLCVLDDENSNGRMDYVLGIMPKEGFAFSNNPRISLRGAPPFSSTSFDFDGGIKQVNVRMVYMR